MSSKYTMVNRGSLPRASFRAISKKTKYHKHKGHSREEERKRLLKFFYLGLVAASTGLNIVDLAPNVNFKSNTLSIEPSAFEGRFDNLSNVIEGKQDVLDEDMEHLEQYINEIEEKYSPLLNKFLEHKYANKKLYNSVKRQTRTRRSSIGKH